MPNFRACIHVLQRTLFHAGRAEILFATRTNRAIANHLLTFVNKEGIPYASGNPVSVPV